MYAAAIATAAQTPQVPSPSQTERRAPSQNRSEKSDQITVTGCLQAAPPTPTGTAGTTEPRSDTASAEPKFVLINAANSTSDPASTAQTPATSRTYRLVANEAALSPHVGKKLELTGTVDGQDSSNTATDSSSASANASAPRAPKLVVESGKIVAETCSQ
jgi:hypothetical protein